MKIYFKNCFDIKKMKVKTEGKLYLIWEHKIAINNVSMCQHTNSILIKLNYKIK